jgi:hypothetical protein
MAEFTRAAAYKQAWVDAAHQLWDTARPEVQIAYGHPGVTQNDDIVAFEAVTSQQDPATLGTNRSREEVLTITVTISTWRPGGPDQEQVASDAAYALLGDLENHVRKTDTTLGGVVRSCFLTQHTSDGATDPDILALGRLIVVAATFTAAVRIQTS